MKQKIYLHIGTPKTGTSSIQRFLLENRDALHLQGYDYPEHKVDANSISSGNGGELLNLILSGNETLTKKYIEVMLSKSDTANIILSSENFYREPKRLSELFPEAKVVVYIRGQLEFIESSYNQSVKRLNQIHSFEREIDAVLKRKDGFYSHDLLNEWAKYYSEDNLVVRAYNPMSFIGGSIYADFMDAIDVKLDDSFVIPKEFTNVSYCGDALIYKLLLNNLFNGTISPESHAKIDQALQQFSQEYYASGGQKYTLYREEQKKRVEESFKESNDYIIKKYFKNDKQYSPFVYENNIGNEIYPGLSNDMKIRLTRYIFNMFPELVESFGMSMMAGLRSDDLMIKRAAMNLVIILSMPWLNKMILKHNY